jgi:chaperone BCS1
LNPATEHKILKHIEWFKDNKSYFAQHGLTYKTAILLKGPPGTGKTSICRALANYMNYDIFILNMSALCDRGNRLAQLPKIPEKSLILVEDIDKSIDSTNMQAVQILMQMLDGMLSCDNTLFAITTNFPEKLPEELIRPGRINLQVDVGLFTMTEALRLGRMYDVPDAIITNLPEATWTHPSALHEFILGYSNDRQENINEHQQEREI